MGDPGFTSPPDYDQRGTGFDRIVNGRIDIGAFEVQAAAPAGSADFDGDGDVDGRDFLAWQRGYGITAPNATKGDGDADDDTDVDGDDLVVWQDQYGTEPELSAFGALAADASDGEADGSRVNFWIKAPGTDEVASAATPVFEHQYAGEVDRAFEQLAATPTSMRSFGEMATHRKVAKRVALELFEAAL